MAKYRYAILAVLALGGCQTTSTTTTTTTTTVTTMAPPPPAPVIATTDQACERIAVNPQPGFSGLVRVTSPQPLRLGQKTRLMLSANAPAYAQLYMLTASGSPVALGENLFLNGGGEIAYPDPRSGYDLTAAPPAGRECLIMLLTRQPFDGLVSSGGANRQPVALTLGLADFVAELNRRTATLPPATWSAAKTQVQVVP
jgi:hypothetical protein